VKKAGFGKPPAAVSDGGGGAAAAPAKRPSTFGGVRKSVTQMIELIRSRDASLGGTADFSSQATFQMDADAKMKDLCDALTGDGSPCGVTNLILKDCGIGARRTRVAVHDMLCTLCSLSCARASRCSVGSRLILH